MKYIVTHIEFDFTDDDFELSPLAQLNIISEVEGSIWDADDEEDLVEEITAAYGWCVTSIDIAHALT